MAMDDKEAFIARWSRRKLEARENAPAAAPPLAPPDARPAVPAMPAPSELAQGRSPEYREFFDPQVDEKLRRSALKKLFSEPQFNVMDGLDTYIDDYSKPDPIPEAMLRQLNQAKDLFLFEEQKTDDGAVDAHAAVPAEMASAQAELPGSIAAATDAEAADSAVPLGSGPGIAR
jgi:hypothetical protein